MLIILKRSFIGLIVGGLAGGVLGVLVGCGIASSDYVANPPQGEDFGFAFTMAAFSIAGPFVGSVAGLATSAINRRWLGIVASMLIGLISGYSSIGNRTPGNALILAIIGVITSVIVLRAIRPVS